MAEQLFQRRSGTTEGRSALQGREERRGVGIGREDYRVLGGRAVEDLLVGCCLQAVNADVCGVVSDCPELLCEARRERVVDKELRLTRRPESEED